MRRITTPAGGAMFSTEGTEATGNGPCPSLTSRGLPCPAPPLVEPASQAIAGRRRLRHPAKVTPAPDIKTTADSPGLNFNRAEAIKPADPRRVHRDPIPVRAAAAVVNKHS